MRFVGEEEKFSTAKQVSRKIRLSSEAEEAQWSTWPNATIFVCATPDGGRVKHAFNETDVRVAQRLHDAGYSDHVVKEVSQAH